MTATQAQSPAHSADDPLSLEGSEVNHSRLGHIPALDGVRGVAILLILFNHFSPEGAYDNSLAKIFQPITTNMTIGVDLFFVLSGFLITGILLRSRESTHYFRNFYIRRSVRIFPLYYFILILLALGLRFIPSWQNLTTLRDAWPWYWFYATNYLIARTGWGVLDHTQVSLGHLWSLAIEEHFYLFWPTVVWIFSNRGLGRWCLALILVAPLWRIYAIVSGQGVLTTYVATQCRMDSLAVGAFLAVAMQYNSAAQLLRRYGWLAILSAFASIACFALNHRVVHIAGESIKLSGLIAVVCYSFFAFAWAGLLLLSLKSGSWMSRIMSHRWLRFFGVYSYGMYIYHRLILNTLTTTFSMRRLAYHGKIWTAVLPHYALCIATTALIAFASYHLFEKHFLRLKRWFE